MLRVDRLTGRCPTATPRDLLREWQGLTYKEIAAGCSASCVETLIFRARGLRWRSSGCVPRTTWARSSLRSESPLRLRDKDGRHGRGRYHLSLRQRGRQEPRPLRRRRLERGDAVGILTMPPSTAPIPAPAARPQPRRCEDHRLVPTASVRMTKNASVLARRRHLSRHSTEPAAAASDPDTRLQGGRSPVYRSPRHDANAAQTTTTPVKTSSAAGERHNQDDALDRSAVAPSVSTFTPSSGPVGTYIASRGSRLRRATG